MGSPTAAIRTQERADGGHIPTVPLAHITADELNQILWLLDQGTYTLSLRDHEVARGIVKRVEARRDAMRQIESLKP